MFRILFGALMAWQAFYYLLKGRYIHYYLKPHFHFTYDFFHFVSPLPEKYLYAVFITMGLAAIGIMLGLLYRFSVFVFLVTYTYVFLLDKAFYNNHYYFIILLSFLMLFVNAHRWASLDQLIWPKPKVLPFWNLFLLRAQVFIVYFFGGIAKLNSDWIQGEPMRHWLKNGSHPAWADPLYAMEWMPYFFSWGGLLFDLSIGFFLIWKRTRFFAFIVILFFNLSNAIMFNIGVFPFLMISAATLFDDPDWPRKIFNRPTPLLENVPVLASRQRLVLSFLGLYLLIQILIPFRHWLYPGNVSWTEEGHFFSWHMKLRDKRGKLDIFVTNPDTQETKEVDIKEDLNRFQMSKLAQRPEFIYQYVQYLKKKAQEAGNQHPVIQVKSRVSLNDRPAQYMVDPNINMADAEISLFKSSPWIVPLDPNAKPGTRTQNIKETEDNEE